MKKKPAGIAGLVMFVICMITAWLIMPEVENRRVISKIEPIGRQLPSRSWYSAPVSVSLQTPSSPSTRDSR